MESQKDSMTSPNSSFCNYNKIYDVGRILIGVTGGNILFIN